MKEYKNIGIFNANNDVIETGFKTIEAAIIYIKNNYTISDWNESEYSLNTVIEDETGSVLLFTDQINPFE